MWIALLIVSGLGLFFAVGALPVAIFKNKSKIWIAWGLAFAISLILLVASAFMIEKDVKQSKTMQALCESVDGSFEGGICAKDGNIINMPGM